MAKSDYQLHREFEDELDEMYPSYKMGNLSWYPSQILKADRVAYEESFFDWLDARGRSDDEDDSEDDDESEEV